MAANTEVLNLSLKFIGVNQKIADLASSESAQAEACEDAYPQALAEVFEEVNWSFAKAYATLQLLDAEDNPAPDQWEFAYQMPEKCRFFRRIVSGAYTDSEASEIKWEIVAGEAGPIILTNQADAVGEFTVSIDNPTFWPALFKRCVALKVAVLIAPSCARGDAFKITERVELQYRSAMAKAAKRNQHQVARRERPDSPMISGRD